MELEVLYKKSTTEDLDYTEPDKSKAIEEEPTLPKKNNGELESEVLFKSGVEDISVSENAIITEESIEFAEPIKPEYVSEEVLFSSETEELDILGNLPIMDNSVLSEESTSELLATMNEESSLVEDNLQLDFSDIESPTSELSETSSAVIKKSFAEKMFEAEDIILQRYDRLKNYILSFKKIKSRISNTADTFNIGRTQYFKLSVSGKSLKLYLNLNVNSIESKFNIIDVSKTKSYEQVPAFLRIRSNRAMNYAYVLIDRVVENFGLEKNPKAVKVDSIQLLKENLEK